MKRTKYKAAEQRFSLSASDFLGTPNLSSTLGHVSLSPEGGKSLSVGEGSVQSLIP